MAYGQEKSSELTRPQQEFLTEFQRPLNLWGSGKTDRDMSQSIRLVLGMYENEPKDATHVPESRMREALGGNADFTDGERWDILRSPSMRARLLAIHEEVQGQ